MGVSRIHCCAPRKGAEVEPTRNSPDRGRGGRRSRHRSGVPVCAGRRQPGRGAVRHRRRAARRRADRARRDHRRRRRRRQAPAGGRLAVRPAAQRAVRHDGARRAWSRPPGSTRASRSSPTSSAREVEEAAVGADDPQGHGRDLGEPHRPGPRRRLREPGLAGVDLPTTPTTYTRLLLARVTVLGVGSTTPTTTTTTTEAGEETTEQLPRTLLTLAVRPEGRGASACSPPLHGELAFALLTENSKVGALRRHRPTRTSSSEQPCQSSLIRTARPSPSS